MADLLCKTFGDESGSPTELPALSHGTQRDIINPARSRNGVTSSGPMVLLYRLTGERYLDFCKYSAPGSSRTIKSSPPCDHQTDDKIASGKTRNDFLS
jgi:hypothetical protein